MPCDGIAFIKPVFPPILLTIVFFNNASKIICDLFQLGSSKAQDCSTTGDKLPVCPGKESINKMNVLCTIYKMQNSRSVSQSGYIHTAKNALLHLSRTTQFLSKTTSLLKI